MSKKVSIIIPCYNHENSVKEAIESALNQTYQNIEIVCVNDCSSDNSSEVIKKLAQKYKNILFIDLNENKGIVKTRNMAIKASSGEYILPLDADDIIEPTYVEKAVKILENNSDIGIVYCKAKFFGNKNEYWNLPEYNLNTFLYVNCIFNCALFRKSDFLHAGMYKENIRNGQEDWDLWMSIIELGLKPYRINEILFSYRQHNNERSNLVLKDNNWKNEIIKNHINLYIKDDNFKNRVFYDSNKAEKKLKKYKKIYTVLFVALILQFIAILILIFI